MKCPKCDSRMDVVTFAGVSIDRCSGCDGLWFDMLEHIDLYDVPGSDTIDIGDPIRGQAFNKIDDYECPRCHGSMIKMVDIKQPHIWFESCHSCQGVFFDAGEFKDFTSYTVADFFKSFMTEART